MAYRKQSIMPGAKKESVADSNAHFVFSQRNLPKDSQIKKDKEPRGVGFMELIQYHV